LRTHNPELKIINLACIRDDRNLFSKINYHLFPTQLLLVEGTNGSGKSSFLRLIAGILTPTAGTILWQTLSIEKNRFLYFRDFHYQGHLPGIKLGLTVAENLSLTKHLLLTNQNPLHDSMLYELGLVNCLNQMAHTLSAGQKKRLSLAKLFLFPKKLWILDEPFNSLDKEMQAIFLFKLENHLKDGGIAIISAHPPFSCMHLVSHHLYLGLSC